MATLKELSEYTGFSIATISRVLNNDPTMSVSDATRAKILEAAGKLRYKATARARKVKADRPRPLHIGMAVMLSPAEQLEDPYYLYLNNYVEQRCHDSGFGVVHLLGQAENYQLPVSEAAIDGIVAIGIFSEKQIERLHSISSNLVFLDSSPDELQYSSVVLDFRLGIEQAIDYLIACGHQRIGFLGPECKLDQKKRPALEVRRQSFIRYMKKKELYVPELMLEAAMTVADARAAVSAHVEAGRERPTALLVANEEAAIGAISALQAHGLSVPKDISIISFNDTPRSMLTNPPLTSISTHADVMSSVAVDLLVRKIREQDILPLKVVVPPTLVERESVMKMGR